MGDEQPLRVGFLGFGAVNAAVAAAIDAGALPGASVVGALTQGHRAREGVATLEIGELVDRVDVVVEAAGHDALIEYGETILRSGCDLLAVSIGAFVDDALFERLQKCEPGRLFLTTGAIGGLDLLRAASESGAFTSVELTTTKRGPSLVQPWMDPAIIERLDHERLTVFEGDAADAARLFPKSLNVAAALALAVKTWSGVTVRVIADPEASVTTHEIRASGPTGEYRFDIANVVSDNPTTSSLTAHAILRGLRGLRTQQGWTFV